MSDDLDKEVVMELYNKLHELVGEYVTDEFEPEAFEAVVLIFSTALVTRAKHWRTNLEHLMDEAFDDVADYAYGLIERKDEKD